MQSHKLEISIPKGKSQQEFALELAHWAWEVICQFNEPKKPALVYDKRYDESTMGIGPAEVFEAWTETNFFKYGTSKLGIAVNYSTEGTDMRGEPRNHYVAGIQFSTFGLAPEYFIKLSYYDSDESMVLEWNLDNNTSAFAASTIDTLCKGSKN